jgi:hypothetical protein
MCCNVGNQPQTYASNISEDRMPWTHRGGSLKTRKVWKLNQTCFVESKNAGYFVPIQNQSRSLEPFLWLLSEVTFSGRRFPLLYRGHCGNLYQSNSSLGCESDSCPRKGYPQWRNTICTQTLIVNHILKGRPNSVPTPMKTSNSTRETTRRNCIR